MELVCPDVNKKTTDCLEWLLINNILPKNCSEKTSKPAIRQRSILLIFNKELLKTSLST